MRLVRNGRVMGPAGLLATAFAGLALAGAAQAAKTDAASSATLMCGSMACSKVAVPKELDPAAAFQGMPLDTRPQVRVRVPGGYEGVTHEGAVVTFRYKGRQALSFEHTSIADHGRIDSGGPFYTLPLDGFVGYMVGGANEGQAAAFIHREGASESDSLLKVTAFGFTPDELARIVGTIENTAGSSDAR